MTTEADDAETENTNNESQAHNSTDETTDTATGPNELPEFEELSRTTSTPNEFTVASEPSTLTDIFNHFNKFVDELRLYTHPGGFRIAAVDPANVLMGRVGAYPGAFQSFNADEGVIAFDIETTVDMLGNFSNDELVHLRYDDESKKLYLESSTMTFSMATIESESVRQPPEIPSIEDQLSGTFDVAVSALNQAADAADMVADQIILEVQPEDDAPLQFQAQGDTDDITLTIHEDDDTLEDATISDGRGDVTMVSLEYFDDLLSSIPLRGDDTVTLQVGNEMPVNGSGSHSDGCIVFLYMLAPRIQSD